MKMKNVTKIITVFSIAAIFYIGFHFLSYHSEKSGLTPVQKKVLKLTKEGNENEETASGRDKFFFDMLRDPKTNSIPVNARLRELQYAKKIDNQYRFLSKSTNTTQSIQGYTWAQAGPYNIGGRTRALALDVTNPSVVIAGGVSGGIWKSTDGGNTWSFENGPDQNLSVTSIAQDPRSGYTNIWYYCTGELVGNSASGINHEAFYKGTGVFKSTDGGNTWTVLPSTVPTNNATYNSPFQVVSRIVVSPTTGSVFLACNLFGIYRSTDGGSTWQAVLAGQANQHYFEDVAVNKNGMLMAALSQFHAGSSTTQTQAPGIYISKDDGTTWTNITPSDFPKAYQRTVLAFSQSNPNIAYSFTYDGTSTNSQDSVSFYKYTFNSNGSISDSNRSANMPNFGTPVGTLDTQHNYNMLLAVKPDDPNFVLLGTTNLWRSFDGFATKADSKKVNWIGGYNTTNDISTYPNQHPDEHIAVFNPQNPDQVYVGSDGGISFSSNITDTSVTTDPVTWASKNEGYITTQFYAATINSAANDNRILGGAQDNGSPYFRISTLSNPYTSADASTGDGAYCYLGTNKAYASVQNGKVFRYSYDSSGNISFNTIDAEVDPSGASNQAYFEPYKIDPNAENVMYYAAGDSLWRNTAINGNTYSTSWSVVSGVAPPSQYRITALGISTNNSSNVLYIGASNPNASPNTSSSSTAMPKLYKLSNSVNARFPTDISSSSFPGGAYINDIAINPNNSNEFIVVFSNYEVHSLYYTNDGGQSYTIIDGNLAGGTSNLGPSIRTAAIVPTSTGTYYFAGTSTGLYMTTTLAGSSTLWVKQASGVIGSPVVTDLKSRTSDHEIVAATHGRGIFVGTLNTSTPIAPPPVQVPVSFKLSQNYPNPFNPSTNISYSLPTTSRVTLTIYDITGRKVAVLLNDISKGSGNHVITFNADHLASGVYLYKIRAVPSDGKASPFTETKKMVLLK